MSVRLCAAHRRRVLRRGAFALLSLVALAGLPAQADDPPVAAGAGAPAVVDGAQVYTQLCQACHMADGGGATGAGTYPSFRGNPNIASATFMAAVVLHGRRNMPSFAPVLDDAEIAAVINHIRTNFGNDYADPITAADVAALHSPTGD